MLTDMTIHTTKQDFLVLRSWGIELEYENKVLDAALTQDERQFILNQISRRCDELVPTAYLTKKSGG